jgi:hypothetical protein
MTSPLTRAAKSPRGRPVGAKPIAARPDLHLDLARQIEGLPRDLGAMLIGLGAVGIAIPGPIPSGTPFVAVGLICSFPRLIARFGGPLGRRFPKLFRFLVDFVARLRLDLRRRYPECVAG